MRRQIIPYAPNRKVIPWFILQRVRHYRMTSSVESNRACLDPNHTHFILVDNGTTEKFGVEIALRSRLEKLLSMRKMDPTGKGELLFFVEHKEILINFWKLTFKDHHNYKKKKTRNENKRKR